MPGGACKLLRFCIFWAHKIRSLQSLADNYVRECISLTGLLEEEDSPGNANQTDFPGVFWEYILKPFTLL